MFSATYFHPLLCWFVKVPTWQRDWLQLQLKGLGNSFGPPRFGVASVETLIWLVPLALVLDLAILIATS